MGTEQKINEEGPAFQAHHELLEQMPGKKQNEATEKYQNRLEKWTNKQIRRRNRILDLLLWSWVAQTGFLPSQCEVIEMPGKRNGEKIYRVRRRTD